MQENLENERIKSAIESLIFISNKPLTIDELKQLFDSLDSNSLRDIVETLKKEHEERNSGVRIVEIAGGYQ
ncbi:MAG TPA: SMC-Scp complex subunit ScpB, partial [Candidatus Omnitrophota bacterium]|nr:SMC-Scp complex subunit ScpB [Candidatus Omnitrophota bacterium]